MAGNFQPTEPTVRLIFDPEHFIKANGGLQLSAFYEEGNDVSLRWLKGETKETLLKRGNDRERGKNQRINDPTKK